MRLLEKIFYERIVKPLLYTSRLGRKSMFGYADSGLNFDHIYKNEAKGYTKFGKFIDKILLNLPASKATRYRKEKIVKILQQELEKNRAVNKKTKIVDLASGPARYLIELMNNSENRKWAEALCLDADRASLQYGKILSAGKPMLYKKVNVLKLGRRYKEFSEKKAWRPNIILVSGLYEYLDDSIVKKSIKDIHNYLDTDGLLFFITQANNPNKKLIENVGITKSGRKWVLFYRKPEILRTWVKEAGYKEMIIELDPWKMYEFCRCRK